MSLVAGGIAVIGLHLASSYRVPILLVFVLIVKFGSDMSTSEAIWQVFRDLAQVPKVYRWRVLEQDVKDAIIFIYMQLVRSICSNRYGLHYLSLRNKISSASCVLWCPVFATFEAMNQSRSFVDFQVEQAQCC